MNRREANRWIALSTFGVVGLAQPQPTLATVRIAELNLLREVWADHEFIFDREKALLVRVPAPEQETPRILKAGEIYLTAFSRSCTHAGCTVPLPDQQHLMVCGCHGSRFKADGIVIAGPAFNDLRGIRLEAREGAVFAVGWL